MPAAHTHPDIELNLVSHGTANYLLGGRLASIEPSHLGLFWGGVPHQLLSSPKSNTSSPPPGGVWITLPLRWLLAWNLPNDLPSRLMAGQLVTLPLPPARAQQWLADFAAGQPHRQILLLELQALLARAALTLPLRPLRPKTHRTARPPYSGSLSDTGVIEHAVTFLAENYHQPLSIDEVADFVQLHPKYLMSTFRRHLGVTIGNYLLSLRLAHAQRLLATTDKNVLDIATHCGFGSLSRFYQAFRTTIGTRPLAFRKAHRQPADTVL
jgi:AraC-like DNA-binding protein